MRTVRRAAVVVLLGALLPAASAEPSRAGDVLGRKKLYSQGDEELVIRDFFDDRRDGFFLDVGCSHPRRWSTTYYLEKHLGWKGIGVDAAAEYAPRWKKLRPNSTFANFLVTNHSGTMDTFYRSDYLPTSTAKKEMAEGKPHEEVLVPSITLNDLLEQEGVEKIDFLSMDIEGFQYEALQGFDIEKYRPDLVCIEKDRPELIPAWFESRGYEMLAHYGRYDFVNWYFAPKDR